MFGVHLIQIFPLLGNHISTFIETTRNILKASKLKRKIFSYTYVHIDTYTHMKMHIHIYVCVCMCICVIVCIVLPKTGTIVTLCCVSAETGT